MPPAYISSFPAGLSRALTNKTISPGSPNSAPALTNKTISPGSPNSAPSPVPAGREPPLQLKPGSSQWGGRSAFRGSMAGATSPGTLCLQRVHGRRHIAGVLLEGLEKLLPLLRSRSPTALQKTQLGVQEELCQKRDPSNSTRASLGTPRS